MCHLPVFAQVFVELEIPHVYHSVARNSPKRQELVDKWNVFQVPYIEVRRDCTVLTHMSHCSILLGEMLAMLLLLLLLSSAPQVSTFVQSALVAMAAAAPAWLPNDCKTDQGIALLVKFCDMKTIVLFVISW